MRNYVLGVDIGTTQIKAAILDESDNIIDLISRQGKVYSPSEGWSEIDMNEMWSIFCSLVKQLINQNPDAAKKIAGIGVAAVGEGLWPLDKDLKPVRNAILWNDTRSRDILKENTKEADDLLKANRATPLCSGSPPVILKWLKDQEPENYAKTEYGIHCTDWINLKLTGNLATDETLASTASINVVTKEYIPELFNLLGIPDKLGAMPSILKSTDIVGCVTPQAAKETGLKYGTPVIAGALDAAATVLGAGVVNNGEVCSVFGTSLCNVMMLDETQVDHTSQCGSTLCYIIPDTYIRMMSTGSGAATIDWAKKLLAPEMYFDELERQISLLPAGSNGIINHPYISGERAPFKDAFACGGFFGLSANHTRYDMMRSVYEGVIFSLKDCYNHMPPVSDRAFVAGGGAASDLLCSLMASILDTTVYRPKAKQLGIIGIASAVKYGLGYCASFQINQEYEGTFLPDKNEGEKLMKIFNEYVSLRKEAKDYWHNAIR